MSALDVSVQAQILNLLAHIQRATGVTYLFISHDLAVVRQIADRVLVLRAGQVVEQGLADAVLTTPADDYTKLLLECTPRPGWKPKAYGTNTRRPRNPPFSGNRWASAT